jgi:preprotein translocase subunit SecA
MLDFITDSLKKIFGTKQQKDVKNYMPVVEEVNEIYKSLSDLSNDELRNKSNEFKDRINEYLSDIDADLIELEKEAEETKDIREKERLYDQIDEITKERDEHLEEVLLEIQAEAFAVVKETCRRFKENETLEATATELDKELAADATYIDIQNDKVTWKNRWMAAGSEIVWDMVHYDVQLIGGMVLHNGTIAEMATGEGKTLVATLPAYLNGLSGLGVHIITVNDYLARRDAEWVGPILEFLGLTVDCIDKYKPHSEERKKAYRCDVTYGTNNEFGFDYLRDNMVRSEDEVVQGKHHFAMIDEVDSVLIDDARTPLIISGPIPKGSEVQEYESLKPRVEKLLKEQKKMVTEYLSDAKRLFKEGKTGYEEDEAGMSLLRAYRSLPKYRPLIKFLSEEGVKQELQKAENFYMQEQSKNMHIVDEPLLFTIDEKNRIVDLTEKGAEFMARGENDPEFFVMPDIATEMEAIESNEELEEKEKQEKKEALIEDYTEKSQRLHSTHQLLKAYTLFEKDQEYVVMDGQVKIVDEQTGRMMEGRRYSDGLHQALEAKENVKVGELTQTYATVTLQNYFRMYHKLSGMTGTAETEAGEFWEIYELDVVVVPTNKPIVRDDREDLVYKTAREKYNAVIEEIQRLTEQGRPVLVGTTSVEISELLSRMLKLKNIKHNVLNAKQHQREADVVAEAGKAGAVTIATNMAGRGTDIKLGEGVKEAGGLAIVGTERHDSRRVDRQLRGRAGRQGDPGSSQFFVSLEDNLMRLFNSERIAKVMDFLGHKEGEVIQHKRITKSIETAQKKVEENNFGIRKRLLEYDDVMNIQREAIYKKRKNALSGERLKVDLNTMFTSMIEIIVEEFKRGHDFEGFRMESLRTLGIDPQVDQSFFLEGSLDDVILQFEEEVMEAYDRKEDAMKQILRPVIENVYEKEGHKYKRILVPYVAPGHKELPISANLEDAVDSGGETIMRDIEKTVTLALIDENWKEHLRAMDELKESVQSASFEQKDPLVIYKMEAYELFESFIYKVNQEVTSYLFNGKLLLPQDNKQIRGASEQKTDMSKMKMGRAQDPEEIARQQAAAQAGQSGEPQQVETFVREGEKVGRNDPCPCGSGKKYKHCHGKP